MLPARSFTLPVTDLVRRRFSCRTFSPREIGVDEMGRIESLLSDLTAEADGRVRLAWLDKSEVRNENFFSSGTYGMIKGNRCFVAGVIRKGMPRIWEDLGSIMEFVVLKLTEMGLDSCWIGGVFDRRRFGRHLNLQEGESLPAVIAVGHRAGRTALRDRLIRWSARGATRKPPSQLFFAGDLSHPQRYEEFPNSSDILENVRWAPSASNKQPWRIIIDSPDFHFYLDRDRVYAKMVPQADLQRIDLGIARCHFHYSALEAGLSGAWLDAEPKRSNLPKSFEYLFTFRMDAVK